MNIFSNATFAKKLSNLISAVCEVNGIPSILSLPAGLNSGNVMKRPFLNERLSSDERYLCQQLFTDDHRAVSSILYIAKESTEEAWKIDYFCTIAS